MRRTSEVPMKGLNQGMFRKKELNKNRSDQKNINDNDISKDRNSKW